MCSQYLQICITCIIKNANSQTPPKTIESETQGWDRSNIPVLASPHWRWSCCTMNFENQFLRMTNLASYGQSVQFSCSVVSDSVTLWTVAHQASQSITNPRSLLKLKSIMLVMPSNHLILCHPLLLLPWIFPSIRVFSKKSVLLIIWPKYWSFSFSISPSNEYSGLISFRIVWLDLLAVQGTLKSLFQHYSSKASILRCSAFSRQQHYFTKEVWVICTPVSLHFKK